MKLADAPGITRDEVVAFVVGGGKTTAMFRLAREVAEKGGTAITTACRSRAAADDEHVSVSGERGRDALACRVGGGDVSGRQRDLRGEDLGRRPRACSRTSGTSNKSTFARRARFLRRI